MKDEIHEIANWMVDFNRILAKIIIFRGLEYLKNKNTVINNYFEKVH